MDYQNSLTLESELIARLERRREWRESLRVPVEVSGFDSRGRFFTERTSTLDVSDSGCCFSLNAEVEKNSAVSVRVVRRRNGLMLDDPAVLFRVVWVRQIPPGWPKWTVAGVKMQPVQLASVGFPAETINPCAASSVPRNEPTA
jgi:hypothetical protein